MKKIFKVSLAAVSTAAAALALASCGGEDGLRICIASTPDHIDPALNSSVDGATYAVHLFSGLVRYVPTADGKGLELAADLATELPKGVKQANGSTKYTFTLRDGIKFSDGTAITAQDFVYSWNRAASYSVVDDKGTESEDDDEVVVSGLDGDYGYMFDVIDGFDSLGEDGKTDPLNFLNVKATNDKTLEVVLPVDVPYFYELCAFPAYAVLKDANDWDKVDVDGTWAKKSGIVTSGAYTLSEFTENVQLKMAKRDDYWDAENVKQDVITAVFSDDDSATLGQYEAGELALINNLPQSMMLDFAKRDDFHIIGQLGTYYVSYNINSPLFEGMDQAKAEKFRTALNLLIDRKYICESVSKGGETPSTGFVGMGLTDPAGGEFVDHNGTAGDGKGYFGDANNYEANKAKAIQMLKELGYTQDADGKFNITKSVNYIVNTSTNHEAIAQAIQTMFGNVGINVTVSKQEWAQFLQTRKKGDYDVARNGWLADYNDPISFLDMWTTSSGNNDCQFGREAAASYTYTIETGVAGVGTLTGTWAQTYDVLISKIKSESDTNKRYALMHKAEDLLVSTGCIGSIYNYTDKYLQSPKYDNMYASPLGYKYCMWATEK